MKARLQYYRNYRSVLTFVVLAGFGVAFAAGCDSNGGKNASDSPTAEARAEQEQVEKSAGDNPGKKEDAELVAPKVIYEEGPAPTPETVLARGKGVEITLADYELAMHRSLLFAPPKEDGSRYLEVPVERSAEPQLQSVLIEHLLETRAVREEATRRGIECSDLDVRAVVATRKPLEKYTKLFGSDGELAEHSELIADLAALKMTVEDVRATACEEVFSKKLQDALLAEISEAELWKAYQQARNTVELLLVAINNTPTSAELDDFIEQDKARKEPVIDAHFAKYPERYMLPRLARLTILRTPPGQEGPEAIDKLQRAANRLSSGEDPKAITSGLGLVLEEGSELHAGENQRAFAEKVGGTGFEVAGPRGAYAWRLEGFRDSEQLELTRALRREIAAELLRESGILESVQLKLKPALEAMNSLGALKKGAAVSEEKVEALRAELGGHELKLVKTPPFVQTAQGFIPGVGLAEEVVEKAFALSEEKPVFDEPVYARERVYVFRLGARERPTRSKFNAEKASFKKSYVDGRRELVVPSFTAAKYADADIVVDMQPLRIKYGSLAKSK